MPTRLTGETDAERALRKLRRLNPGLLCMTRAEEGSVAFDGDRCYASPAFPIQLTDNTGAGDVFRGALIYSLLRGEAPDAMLVRYVRTPGLLEDLFGFPDSKNSYYLDLSASFERVLEKYTRRDANRWKPRRDALCMRS